ncbi:MAG: response regulator [Patescibacteria group bacterium]
MKILIVEDEILVARMYQKMAKSENFKIELATNGAMGIEKAKEWKPDVILMDIMMPKMNGIQALEKLKADSETKDIPVVILTNMSGKHDIELAISKGAIDFWVKKDLEPKNFKDKLLAVLKK